jgi:hypothetical protein
VGGAVFQALPGQSSGKAVASALTGGTSGGLYSGQATDPNTGPMLALMGLALPPVSRRR